MRSTLAIAAIAVSTNAFGCEKKNIPACEDSCSILRSNTSYTLCMSGIGCWNNINWQFQDATCEPDVEPVVVVDPTPVVQPTPVQDDPHADDALYLGCERQNIPACEDSCSILRSHSSYTLCMSSIGCWDKINWQFQDATCEPVEPVVVQPTTVVEPTPTPVQDDPHADDTLYLGCEKKNIPACEDSCSILRAHAGYTLCMSSIGCWDKINWQFNDSTCEPDVPVVEEVETISGGGHIGCAESDIHMCEDPCSIYR